MGNPEKLLWKFSEFVKIILEEITGGVPNENVGGTSSGTVGEVHNSLENSHYKFQRCLKEFARLFLHKFIWPFFSRISLELIFIISSGNFLRCFSRNFFSKFADNPFMINVVILYSIFPANSSMKF